MSKSDSHKSPYLCIWCWKCPKEGLIPYVRLHACTLSSRVETPITNHLRNYAPNLEKYKVVQILLV